MAMNTQINPDLSLNLSKWYTVVVKGAFNVKISPLEAQKHERWIIFSFTVYSWSILTFEGCKHSIPNSLLLQDKIKDQSDKPKGLLHFSAEHGNHIKCKNRNP